MMRAAARKMNGRACHTHLGSMPQVNGVNPFNGAWPNPASSELWPLPMNIQASSTE